MLAIHRPTHIMEKKDQELARLTEHIGHLVPSEHANGLFTHYAAVFARYLHAIAEYLEPKPSLAHLQTLTLQPSLLAAGLSLTDTLAHLARSCPELRILVIPGSNIAPGSSTQKIRFPKLERFGGEFELPQLRALVGSLELPAACRTKLVCRLPGDSAPVESSTAYMDVARALVRDGLGRPAKTEPAPTFRSAYIFLEDYEIAITGDDTTPAPYLTREDARWETEAAALRWPTFDIKFTLPRDADGRDLFSFMLTVANPALDSMAVLIGQTWIDRNTASSCNCAALRACTGVRRVRVGRSAEQGELHNSVATAVFNAMRSGAVPVLREMEWLGLSPWNDETGAATAVKALEQIIQERKDAGVPLERVYLSTSTGIEYNPL